MGPYRNLVENHADTFQLRREEGVVYATFQADRSPVQFLARDQPEVLLTVPTGFRPTVGRHLVHCWICGNPELGFACVLTDTRRDWYSSCNPGRLVSHPRLDTVMGWSNATQMRSRGDLSKLPATLLLFCVDQQQQNYNSAFSKQGRKPTGVTCTGASQDTGSDEPGTGEYIR